MRKIVIVFESRYGQSEKVADRIAELATKRGFETCEVLAHEAPPGLLMDAAAAFVVAPIYFSKHPKALEDFVTQNAVALSAMPSALFSVSGSAADPKPEAHAALEAIDRAFLQRTGWAPRDVEWVAGAFSWPRYGFLVRTMMKQIAKSKGARDIDTSKVDEFTNWAAVDTAIETVLDMIGAPVSSPRAAHAYV